eukprot:gnl/Dysnectes_brevis/7448_a12471_436.p1 GENE.gnl/Dysnectes_brevis/7448_a12471_436~~gnl/Dysnectes_brevis/7448_a12471_436.p1  ORF type:complete len:254 (-),score=46.36 gnl/Dysnectes_brevis/7448_a12471_436:293-1054(-)
MTSVSPAPHYSYESSESSEGLISAHEIESSYLSQDIIGPVESESDRSAILDNMSSTTMSDEPRVLEDSEPMFPSLYTAEDALEHSQSTSFLDHMTDRVGDPHKKAVTPSCSFSVHGSTPAQPQVSVPVDFEDYLFRLELPPDDSVLPPLPSKFGINTQEELWAIATNMWHVKKYVEQNLKDTKGQQRTLRSEVQKLRIQVDDFKREILEARAAARPTTPEPQRVGFFGRLLRRKPPPSPVSAPPSHPLAHLHN